MKRDTHTHTHLRLWVTLAICRCSSSDCGQWCLRSRLWRRSSGWSWQQVRWLRRTVPER